MPYELIDHTADIGIAVTASSVGELFETAAHAMFEQIADTRALTGWRRTRLTVSGIDREDLMINWLRELLFLWNGRQYLLKQARIENMANTELTARIWYDPFDRQTHEILNDIKAVTYHGIRVEKTDAGWTATVIFDV